MLIKSLLIGREQPLSARILQLSNPEQVEGLRVKGLELDWRSKVHAEEGVRSVFDGIDFDPANIRTQAFLLEDQQDGFMGITTFCIAPYWSIATPRYLQRTSTAITVRDIRFLTRDNDFPQFLISIGWTHARTIGAVKYSPRIYRGICRVIRRLESLAPANTWIEIIARGTAALPSGFAAHPNLEILEAELPFPAAKIGRCHSASRATPRLARLLGMQRARGVGALPTLGPTFLRRCQSASK